MNKIQIQISETEDYCIFKNSLEESIDDWKSQKYSKKGLRSSFQTTGGCFTLWGEAGTGKSEYLKIWMNNMEGIIEINDLCQIEDDEQIYLFDGVNESVSFDEEQLQKIIRSHKIFLIYSGWDRSKIFSGHNIEPSENIVNERGWANLAENCWSNSFSIREKNLMCEVKNSKKIKNKEFHSLIWKAFENVMTNSEITYYKAIAKENPLKIEWSDKPEFQSLYKKHIIQYNEKQKHYIFSHQNIVNYLFFRQHSQKIKNLSIKDKYLIEVINQQPTQFINWWTVLGGVGDISDFIIKNKITISVRDHKLFEPSLDNEKILYSALTFDDLRLLSENNKYNRMYKEYLLENIDTRKVLKRGTNLYAKDIVYFIYSIVSPIMGDDEYPMVMNSMEISGFEKHINWKNKTNRQQMLNFILGRYIQGYVNQSFSALEISELTETIYSHWDIKNKLTFFEFVNSCWNTNQVEGFETFDAVLNCGKGRSSILDASSRYSKFDDRFENYRNSMGHSIFDKGHRAVNYVMYDRFEKHKNKIQDDEMGLYYRKQYDGSPFHQGTQITDPFEKFLMLLVERYVYFYKNEPVYIEKFNHNIEVLPTEIQNDFVHNNITPVFKAIKKLLSKHPNLIELTWKINKEMGKGGFNYIWIKSYYIYSLYDSDILSNKLWKSKEIFDEDGLEYNIKNSQIIKMSKIKTFDKFIVSYKLDDIDGSGKIHDKSFIIQLNHNENKPKMMKYKDINRWSLTSERKEADEDKKHENQILKIIKDGFIK